ncbi:MAG: 6-bladed beta-propeller [Bacteroidales bacterium]|nr:6-bladed beta-propeller [Bacteroidales bacterium]
MKKNGYLVYLIIACLLLFGCKQAKDTIFSDTSFEGSEIIDIGSIDANSILKYSEIFESVSFVRLETHDSALIGSIDKIVVADNKFVILDETSAKMVFVFDNNGKFLNRIGSIGEGPEEYKRPDDIVYDKYKDELLVWSNDDKSIFQFKLDGTFLGKIKTKFWGAPIAVADTNTYLLKISSSNSHNIVVVNEKGDILSQLFPFNKDTERLDVISMFAPYQNELLFTQYYNNTVFTVNKDKMKAKYYVDFHKHNIPVSSFSDVTHKELRNIIVDNDYAFIIRFMETSSHAVLQYVYKGIIFDGYYSKTTKILKTSGRYLNDMYALCNVKTFIYTNNDSLISFVEPQAFTYYQNLLKNGDKNNIKDLLQKNLQMAPAAEIISDKYRKNYLKTLESANLKLTDEEIDFINSISEFDNPILWIATLKK